MDVFLQDESFDGGGTGGRRTEAACRHGFAQLLLLDQLAGALHRREQRRFGEARRRLGLIRLHLDIIGPDALLGLHRCQLRGFVFTLGFLAVDGEPAGRHQHFAFRLERLAFDTGDAGRHVVFRRREKNREEALGDEVVELLLRV